MGSSDVRLEEAWVTVDAAALNVVATDILLASPSRRAGETGGIRRALVHDSTDGLTVNFGRDYTGGVTINDARVNLRCIVSDGGKPELPRRGRAGDLVATLSVTRVEGTVVGEQVTLWFCIGSPVQRAGVGRGAMWVPVTTGAAVEGAR